MSTHRLSPCRCRSRNVPSTRIPGNLRDTEMFPGAQHCNISSLLSGLSPFIDGEVKIPELDIKLAGRPYSGQRDMATFWWPNKSIGHFAVEMLDWNKITLLQVKLIEVDAILRRRTRYRGRVSFCLKHNCEPSPQRLPRKLWNVIWRVKLAISIDGVRIANVPLNSRTSTG